MLQEIKTHSHVVKPVLHKTYPIVQSGKGVYLYDDSGKQYLDGCSGAIVANIGHGIEEIANAAYEQAKTVSFVYRTQFTSTKLEELANWIVERSRGMEGVFFVNSGSEATEAALRVATQYWQEKKQPQKQIVLSRKISYHGMTLGALNVTGNYTRRQPFTHLLTHSHFVNPAYCYRCPLAQKNAQCCLRCADDLEETIRQIGADKIAAFIVEPIVGASGAAIVPSDSYFERVQDICRHYGILLILDEVLTGIGRTGAWLAMDHWNVEPDLVILGKGLSAGFTPISAVLISPYIMMTMQNGSGNGPFGHTYGGNPLSAAISLAVLQYIEKHDLIAQVRLKEPLLKERLLQLAQKHPMIGDIRGKGFLWGLEFVANRASRQPFAPSLQLTQHVVDTAFQKENLLVYPSAHFIDLTTGDAVLVAPPFTMMPEEMDDLIARLDRTLTMVEESLVRGY